MGELKKQLAKQKMELQHARENAGKQSAAGATVDEGMLKLWTSRAGLHEQLVGQMLEGVNNSVSLLRRNSDLIRTTSTIVGCWPMPSAAFDYTRLEPEQQQMLVELIDQTQPDVIVKNMQGIGAETPRASSRRRSSSSTTWRPSRRKTRRAPRSRPRWPGRRASCTPPIPTRTSR